MTDGIAPRDPSATGTCDGPLSRVNLKSGRQLWVRQHALNVGFADIAGAFFLSKSLIQHDLPGTA